MTTRGFFFWDTLTWGAPPTISGFVPLNANTSGHDYPKAAGGVTAGTVDFGNSAIAAEQSNGWVEGTHSPLLRAALRFPDNTSTVQRVRLDLPAPGEFDVRIWCGNRGFAQPRWRLLDSDGTTPLYDVTCSPAFGGATPDYYGTDGAVRPIGSFAANPAQRVTVSSTSIFLEIRGISFRGGISGMDATAVAAPGPSAAVIRRRRSGMPIY